MTTVAVEAASRADAPSSRVMCSPPPPKGKLATVSRPLNSGTRSSAASTRESQAVPRARRMAQPCQPKLYPVYCFRPPRPEPEQNSRDPACIVCGQSKVWCNCEEVVPLAEVPEMSVEEETVAGRGDPTHADPTHGCPFDSPVCGPVERSQGRRRTLSTAGLEGTELQTFAAPS